MTMTMRGDMMKARIALLFFVCVSSLFAGGFTEGFKGERLSDDNWMLTYMSKCTAVAYKRPLNGKLVITGLENAKGNDAFANLDRDAGGAAGDFRLSARFELSPSKENGYYDFYLLTENGEALIGARLECKKGKIALSGKNGHSCATVKSETLALSASKCLLEIVRVKDRFQVLFNGKSVFTASGDTASAASFRLQVSGTPGVLTISSLSLK